MVIDESTRFIMKMFSRHYRQTALAMPDRFSKREFGFMFYDRQGMVRHTAFPTRASLKKYLIEQTPAHVYYSCAYYEKPDAQTMPEKKWLGADLIFDLDADHVEGAQNMPYEKMLERVKEEVTRLVDEFLLGDLGVPENELKIAFSGGRGYHVHINSPKVLRLTSHERREIVDFVTGTDLDIDWLFPPKPFEISRFKDRVDSDKKRTMPSLDDGGWRRRIRKGIDTLLDEIESMDPVDARSKLAELFEESKRDIGKKTLEGLYKDLFGGKTGKRGVDRMRAENTFEVFSEKRHSDAFLDLVDMRVRGRMKGETDEPVTSDIKRLIRLPTSLHGKTGFEVVPLTRRELTGFNPFDDAVSKAFGEEEVAVRCEKPCNVTLKGRDFALDSGSNSVPEFAAVYLLCRKLASISTKA
ncbi:MAG: hypothetical protein A3K76_01765 [Euryarchaeota archaeon RBG_13_57_23]|nr:MAG: hypothetical protein A3K69_01310 [Candidatus Bathyarchaeota archaeon RBG_16_57_9]OGS45043.1 MAG: hypothetical protein A3K76_01765 [Euryarchaeota archaeon RBG_13_57_23]